MRSFYQQEDEDGPPKEAMVALIRYSNGAPLQTKTWLWTWCYIPKREMELWK